MFLFSNYASLSSGEAYIWDWQLTTNFELWVETFCVPTCFHVRILKSCPSICLYPEKRNYSRFVNISLKVALDGGTRPGDTLQILPLALAQPLNPRSITSHSVLRRHPSLTHRIGFFRGIHSQKIIIGTAICFFLRKYAFQMKNIKHTHTHNI